MASLLTFPTSDQSFQADQTRYSSDPVQYRNYQTQFAMLHQARRAAQAPPPTNLPLLWHPNLPRPNVPQMPPPMLWHLNLPPTNLPQTHQTCAPQMSHPTYMLAAQARPFAHCGQTAHQPQLHSSPFQAPQISQAQSSLGAMPQAPRQTVAVADRARGDIDAKQPRRGEQKGATYEIAKTPEELEREKKAYAALGPEYGGLVRDDKVVTTFGHEYKFKTREDVHKVLDEVASMHSKKVVHGDLKGSHILTAQGRDVFFIDFGFARVGEDAVLQQTLEVTPKFTSMDRIIGGEIHPLDDYEAVLLVAFGQFAHSLSAKTLPEEPKKYLLNPRGNPQELKLNFSAKDWLRYKIKLMQAVYVLAQKADTEAQLKHVCKMLVVVWVLPRTKRWLRADEHQLILGASTFNVMQHRSRIWDEFRARLTRADGKKRPDGSTTFIARPDIPLGAAPRASDLQESGEEVLQDVGLPGKEMVEDVKIECDAYPAVHLWGKQTERAQKRDKFLISELVMEVHKDTNPKGVDQPEHPEFFTSQTNHSQAEYAAIYHFKKSPFAYRADWGEKVVVGSEIPGQALFVESVATRDNNKSIPSLFAKFELLGLRPLQILLLVAGVTLENNNRRDCGVIWPMEWRRQLDLCQAPPHCTHESHDSEPLPEAVQSCDWCFGLFCEAHSNGLCPKKKRLEKAEHKNSLKDTDLCPNLSLATLILAGRIHSNVYAHHEEGTNEEEAEECNKNIDALALTLTARRPELEAYNQGLRKTNKRSETHISAAEQQAVARAKAAKKACLLTEAMLREVEADHAELKGMLAALEADRKSVV